MSETMSLGLFGEFEHTMDSKGRVSLPASFRKVLPDTVVLVPGPQGQINVFSDEGFANWKEKFIEERGGYRISGGDTSKLRLKLNSSASFVDIDSAGRVNVPKKMRDFASLSKDVVVVGDEDHVCLWDAGKWSEYMDGFDLFDFGC